MLGICLCRCRLGCFGARSLSTCNRLNSSSRSAENKDNRESGDSETKMSNETNADKNNTDQQDELVTIATFPEPMEANMARVSAGSCRHPRICCWGDGKQHDSGGL